MKWNETNIKIPSPSIRNCIGILRKAVRIRLSRLSVSDLPVR